MYVQVRMAIRSFLESDAYGGEGYVRSMYLDKLGLLTTGRGNRLPNPESANSLNGARLMWEKINGGGPATPEEVKQEWNRVNAVTTSHAIAYERIGGGNFIKEGIKAGIVTLQLTKASVDQVFDAALKALEDTVKTTAGFANFDKIPGGFPADAELGILSLVWAAGAGALSQPWLADFSRSCAAGRWGDIASQKQYKWSQIRPGRDAALQQVFQKAQLVEDKRKAAPNTDVTIISQPFADLALNPYSNWQISRT